MFYKYNSESIKFEPVNVTPVKWWYVLIAIIPYLLVLASFLIPSENNIISFEKEKQLIILTNENQFSEEKLVDKIKQLNFKFPHIVLAQSKLETGNFSSLIFKEQNNLFGMKEAKVRINLAKGTRNNHAYYDSWNESLLDYALYASTYLSKIKNEEQYFDYLRQNYAEDTLYVTKIKNIIHKENLELLF